MHDPYEFLKIKFRDLEMGFIGALGFLAWLIFLVVAVCFATGLLLGGYAVWPWA
jgi:hypothetical protein